MDIEAFYESKKGAIKTTLANFFKAHLTKATAEVEGIEEEDDEADLTVVPEEVGASECDRSTTVMMIKTKAVDRDTILMVAKSTESAFAPMINIHDLEKSRLSK